MRDITVAFPLERDIEAWERAHAQGIVPSRWPYGLDELAASGSRRRVGLGELARPMRAWSLVRSSIPDRSTGRAVVTWDENAAARLPATRGISRHSGVIWLTDGAASSHDVRSRVRWLRQFESLWVLSSAQIAPLRDLVGRHGPRISSVAFGVDHEFFGLRSYPSRPLVLSVGGDRDRDVVTLYRAMADVKRSLPHAEIVVQTSSSLEPPEGIARVARVSHLELRELYARASVVTIATRPNLHVSGMTVSLEAMATGRPVVITGTPGMRDYVQQGVNGLIVSPGDADALARQTVALLRDESRGRELGMAGRVSVVASRTTADLCAGIRRAVDGPVE
ncbi:D-inositol-3-phosphate glycosyltransferase [mine drainage metagenome]|uniref:D-inositol-3-phosphate glycosyltransferase n=1 Tax=mine drainage metagenome TaxID=410659 RepID=A0A1J5RHL5_9ZZZZ